MPAFIGPWIAMAAMAARRREEDRKAEDERRRRRSSKPEEPEVYRPIPLSELYPCEYPEDPCIWREAVQDIECDNCVRRRRVHERRIRNGTRPRPI